MNIDPNNDDRLREIADSSKPENANLAELISEAIPLLEGRIKPLELLTLKHALHGFENATSIEYYSKASVLPNESGYIPFREMPHRERPGKLVIVKQNGEVSAAAHELAQRDEFFISRPVGDLQKLLGTARDTVLVELPELTEYIGEQEGGRVALEIATAHITQIVANTARGLRTLIDLAITPGRREALDEYLSKGKPNV